jgi:hypothetical protein
VSKRSVFALLCVALVPALPTTLSRLAPLDSRLSAQAVGHLPEASPFTDLHDGQRLGIVGGYLVTGRDPVGVNPASGALLGLRYDWYAGGPAYLTGRFFTVRSDREILDYTRKQAFRNVGTQTCNIWGADVGLGIALTGDRSWHKLQPLVNLGVGMAGGAGDKQDVSHFSFSPTFAFSYGLGLRWVTGRNSEFRADVSWYYWQMKYPDLYRSTQGDSVAIRPSGSMSPYVRNRALTLSYTFGVFR